MKKLLIICSFLFFSNAASATLIETQLVNVTGNTWQAEYTISNTTLGTAIEEFVVYYTLGLYENVSAVSAPTDWDPLIAQPDAFIPDDGFYDVLALGAGIGVNQSLSGFVVSFDWLGSGQPLMAQSFEILDPISFTVLDTGLTQINTVPEPPIVALLGFLALLVLSRYDVKG